MSRRSTDTKLPDVESLFAIERVIVPLPDVVRNRVIQRARASLPRNSGQLVSSRGLRRRRLRVGEGAAAAVLLSALCAAAFYMGYESRGRESVAPATSLASSTSLASPLASSTSHALPPTTPVTSVSVLPTSLEPTMPLSLQRKTRGVVPAGAMTESEGYAAELRLLQPAQLAVSQRDFGSALSAIAEHQRQFPSGRLAEEREALRVRALLGLGRTAEAERVGDAFRIRFPNSALLGRVDKMLGTRK